MVDSKRFFRFVCKTIKSERSRHVHSQFSPFPLDFAPLPSLATLNIAKRSFFFTDPLSPPPPPRIFTAFLSFFPFFRPNQFQAYFYESSVRADGSTKVHSAGRRSSFSLFCKRVPSATPPVRTPPKNTEYDAEPCARR